MSESAQISTKKSTLLSSSEMPICESVYQEIPEKDETEKIINLRNIGDKMLSSLQFQEAYDVYSQALPLVYQNTCPCLGQQEDLLINLAKCSLSLNKYNECKQFCYEIISLNDKSVSGHYYLGQVYKNDGNNQKFKQYNELAKKYAGTYENYIKICEIKEESNQQYLEIPLLLIISTGCSYILLKNRNKYWYFLTIINWLSFIGLRQYKKKESSYLISGMISIQFLYKYYFK